MDAEKKSKIRAELGMADSTEKTDKHKGHEGSRRNGSSFINLCALGVLRV